MRSLRHKNKTMRHKAIQDGVAEAFDYWLSQHDVSTPECIMIAIEKAFYDWLCRNSDDLIEKLAMKVAERVAKSSQKLEMSDFVANVTENDRNPHE